MENNKAKTQEQDFAQNELQVKENEQVKFENPDEVIRDVLERLDDFGGFELFTILDENFENLDPETPAVKDVYLTETEWKEGRKSLKENIEVMLSIISKGETLTDMIEICETEADNNQQLFNKNLKKALDRTRKLEQAYWNVGMFFKNVNGENLEFLQIMNVSRESLSDLNDRKFFPAIENILKEGYHKFDLAGNFTQLVIPGWLGTKQSVDKYGEMVHKYKVMLITDYRDFDLKSAKKLLEKDSLAGSAAHLQHIVMTYNQIVARKKADFCNEKDDLHVSAAAALSGLMYDTESAPIAQPRAGTKFGRIKEASAVNEELLDFQAAAIDDKSLVPFIFSKNSIFAWGNKTLFNGNNKGLQDYAIVKTFDWIGKVLMNFVTDECFKRFTPKLKNELRENIMSFLNDYMGPDKLIQQYDLKGITQDPKTKDIIIDLEITPFFAAKNFYIKLTGHEGKDFDSDIK